MNDLSPLAITLPMLRKRTRIGVELVEAGLSRERLAAALDAQKYSAARIGDIVSNRGWISRGLVTAAAARQFGVIRADLRAEPPDPALADIVDPAWCVAHRMAPWRRDGEVLTFVAADVDLAQRALADLATVGLAHPGPVALAVAAPDDVAEASATLWGDRLAVRAASRTALPLSARAPAPCAPLVLGAGALALGVAAALGAMEMLGALFFALVAINAMNAGLRLAALRRALAPRRDPVAAAPVGATLLAEHRPPPRITLLVPLLREPESLPSLMDALERLDWPRELLDVKLILEADDEETRAALDAFPPPPFCSILTVPPGGPRTKPRALNYALDFAEGEIVGVYDAEDQPEPDQLRRIADIFRAAPPEVACVQCRLSYYNAREGWLTRCFAIEYAIWFDVLLGGYRDLGLPIPLGGTSVFFRRSALEAVGAWDAHNVTEDADLGMRLARLGFRTEVCASTTHEEASSRPGQWLRQRSRWLKGYMTTWMVHMRQPATLLRELGLRGFLGFQAIFLGGVVAYLGLPLFWVVWALTLAGRPPAWLADASTTALVALFAVQMAGWAAMIAAALAATARRGERWLWPTIPTMLVYWPMGAVAAYAALVELAVAPTLWRKTPHGLGVEAARLRADAVRRRKALAEVSPAVATG